MLESQRIQKSIDWADALFALIHESNRSNELQLLPRNRVAAGILTFHFIRSDKYGLVDQTQSWSIVIDLDLRWLSRHDHKKSRSGEPNRL